MKYFRNDFTSTIAKYDIIRKAKMYKNGIVIAVTEQNGGRGPAAQAADELLSISGVTASFVLRRTSRAASVAPFLRRLNVQLISEALGGGGNAASAGAQLPGKTPTRLIRTCSTPSINTGREQHGRNPLTAWSVFFPRRERAGNVPDGFRPAGSKQKPGRIYP
jgi:hypothetical protein